MIMMPLRLRLWNCVVITITTIITMFAALDPVEAVLDEFKDSSQRDFSMDFGSISFLLAALASIAVFVLVVVVLIPICMDCMNSEVSSMNHAACGVQHPEPATQNYILPSAPAYSGFSGYSATGQSNVHFNPMNQEPPPPYEASFGNRQ